MDLISEASNVLECTDPRNGTKMDQNQEKSPCEKSSLSEDSTGECHHSSASTPVELGQLLDVFDNKSDLRDSVSKGTNLDNELVDLDKFALERMSEIGDVTAKPVNEVQSVSQESTPVSSNGEKAQKLGEDSARKFNKSHDELTAHKNIEIDLREQEDLTIETITLNDDCKCLGSSTETLSSDNGYKDHIETNEIPTIFLGDSDTDTNAGDLGYKSQVEVEKKQKTAPTILNTEVVNDDVGIKHLDSGTHKDDNNRDTVDNEISNTDGKVKVMDCDDTTGKDGVDENLIGDNTSCGVSDTMTSKVLEEKRKRSTGQSREVTSPAVKKGEKVTIEEVTHCDKVNSNPVSVIILDDDDDIKDNDKEDDEKGITINRSKDDSSSGDQKHRGMKRGLTKSEKKEFLAHPPSPPATRSRKVLPPEIAPAKSGAPWTWDRRCKQNPNLKPQPVEFITLESDDSDEEVKTEKVPRFSPSKKRPSYKKKGKCNEPRKTDDENDYTGSTCLDEPGPSSVPDTPATMSGRTRARGSGSTNRGRGRGGMRSMAGDSPATGKYTESIDSDTDVSDILSDELHLLNSSGILDVKANWKSKCCDDDGGGGGDDGSDDYDEKSDKLDREVPFTYEDVRENARKVKLPTALWSLQIDKRDRFVVYTRLGPDKGKHPNVEKALMFPASIKPVAFIQGKRVPLQFIPINAVDDIAEILANLNKVAFCSGTGIKQRPIGRNCFGYMNIPNKGQRCSDCLEERRRLLLSYCRKLKRRLASGPMKHK